MKIPIGRLSASFGLSLLCQLPVAHASDHGCRVLLCLANPAGPMAEQQCIPDIQKLKRDLALKRPFPTCEEGAPATMHPQMRLYDPCRDGSSALGSGSKAVSMSEADYTALKRSAVQSGIRLDRTSFGIVADVLVVAVPQGIRVETGIGEGSNSLDGPNKICVANPLGDFTIATGASQSAGETDTPPLPEYETISVFRNLSTIGPATSPFVVDIFIDGKLFRSVRP